MSEEQNNIQQESAQKELKQNDFMVEKIKQRPINKKKLIRRTLTTVFMAVMFGTIACVTFLFLEPIISNRLNPSEELKPEPIVFPETEDEISPEDMLLESSQESILTFDEENEVSETDVGTMEEPTLEEQIYKILEKDLPDKNDYIQIYNVLSRYVRDLNPYMVTVTGVSSNRDWFDDVLENKSQVSGVVIGNNGWDILIIADYTRLEKADVLDVTLYNNVTVNAELKRYDKYTGLAILGVKIEDLPEEYLEGENGAKVASLQFSGYNRNVGMPVIALGSPMGNPGSIGYGIINSLSGQQTNVDTNYRLLSTDIIGSSSASGALFNMQGQVVGFITTGKGSSDMQNLITAYSLGELRAKIEKMINGEEIAYLGVTGLDVTSDAHLRLGVPYGAYVRKTEMDSPAMLAGIRSGDVITKIGTTIVSSYGEYIDALLNYQPGDYVEIVIMRQNQTDYTQLELRVTLQ